MLTPSDFADRASLRELMDDLSGDTEELQTTLRRFRITNALFSRSRFLLRTSVLADAHRRGTESFSIVDVGAGGCDIMLWFFKAAQRRGFRPRVLCIDHDPRAVEFGRTVTRDCPAIQVIHADLEELGTLGPFDYAFSNHLLHHLSEEEAVRTLEVVRQITKRLYLINDVRRSAAAYYGFTLLAGTLFPRSMAYEDGRLSIRRSFRAHELARLTHHISNGDVFDPEVFRLFPARVCAVGRGMASTSESGRRA